jgi:hypothetical protein
MMVRWRHQLERANDRWLIADWSKQDVLKHYRDTSDSMLPKFLLGSDTRIAWRHLPYGYPSVKKKCYSGEARYANFRGFVGPTSIRHTCTKAAHSCLRNIISFSCMPGKKVLRDISRALVHLTHLAYSAWAVPNLSKAAVHVTANISAMSPCPHHRQCVSCGVMLTHTTLRVYDAGQAYEVLDINKIISNLNDVIQNARNDGVHLVQILRSVKSLTDIAHTLRRDLGDRTIFKLESISKCVQAYLKMRIYRIGNKFMVQRAGVPIGGPLSGALLRLTLSKCEADFDTRWWPGIAEGLGLSGSRGSSVAASRYEDDLLLTSHIFCSGCLDTLVDFIYKDAVPFKPCTDFEATESDDSINKFLDFYVKCRAGVVNINIFNPNYKFALSGSLSDYCKHRFPPPHGHNDQIISKLAQNFMCRRARWSQLGLCSEQILKACAADVCELFRLGHSGANIRKAWHRSRGHDAGYIIGLKVIKLLPSSATCYRHGVYLASFVHIAEGLRALFDVHLPSPIR